MINCYSCELNEEAVGSKRSFSHSSPRSFRKVLLNIFTYSAKTIFKRGLSAANLYNRPPPPNNGHEQLSNHEASRHCSSLTCEGKRLSPGQMVNNHTLIVFANNNNNNKDKNNNNNMNTRLVRSQPSSLHSFFQILQLSYGTPVKKLGDINLAFHSLFSSFKVLFAICTKYTRNHDRRC